jgi:5,10-methylenetetrahydromethanopterin reductase
LKFKSVDVGFAGLEPADCARLAKTAEGLGFGCVWLQEGGGWGAIPLAASILVKTKTIKVGTGIVSPFRRHPLSLVEDATTLNEASNGRFILGMGSSPHQLKTTGIWVSQLKGMREAVEIIRRSFSGEAFTYRARYSGSKSPASLESD